MSVYSILPKVKARREREAWRGRLGKGRFNLLVMELARIIRLAFEAGDIGSPFGLEGPLRATIRADLCRDGWSWQDADRMAMDLIGQALWAVAPERPDWNEGQPEWTIEAGMLIERTRCARCHGPLPEGRPKFCSDLCKSGHHVNLSVPKTACEDRVVKIVTTRRST